MISSLPIKNPKQYHSVFKPKTNVHWQPYLLVILLTYKKGSLPYDSGHSTLRERDIIMSSSTPAWEKSFVHIMTTILRGQWVRLTAAGYP